VFDFLYIWGITFICLTQLEMTNLDLIICFLREHFSLSLSLSLSPCSAMNFDYNIVVFVVVTDSLSLNNPNSRVGN